MGGHGVDDEEHRRKHDRDQFNLHTSLISADMHDLRVAACIRDRRGKSLLVQRLLDPRAADAVSVFHDGKRVHVAVGRRSAHGLPSAAAPAAAAGTRRATE